MRAIPVTPPAKPPRRGWRVLVLLALIASLALLVAGLTEPALHLRNFYVFNEDVSILEGIAAFRGDGQLWLAIFLYAVSAVFPFTKIILAMLITATYNPASKRSHAIAIALAELSRWSMTDVFILAVAVMVIDGRVLSSANLMPGAYYFAGAILLSSAAVHIVRGALKRHARRLESKATA